MHRHGGLGLGIVAPDAVHRTTLQKNSGADTRAVVNAKLPDIENNAFRHGYPSFLSNRQIQPPPGWRRLLLYLSFDQCDHGFHGNTYYKDWTLTEDAAKDYG